MALYADDCATYSHVLHSLSVVCVVFMVVFFFQRLGRDPRVGRKRFFRVVSHYASQEFANNVCLGHEGL